MDVEFNWRLIEQGELLIRKFNIIEKNLKNQEMFIKRIEKVRSLTIAFTMDI